MNCGISPHTPLIGNPLYREWVICPSCHGSFEKNEFTSHCYLCGWKPGDIIKNPLPPIPDNINIKIDIDVSRVKEIVKHRYLGFDFD